MATVSDSPRSTARDLQIAQLKDLSQTISSAEMCWIEYPGFFWTVIGILSGRLVLGLSSDWTRICCW